MKVAAQQSFVPTQTTAVRSFTPAATESANPDSFSSSKEMGDIGEGIGRGIAAMFYGIGGLGVGGVGGTWAGYAIGSHFGHPAIGMALGGIGGAVGLGLLGFTKGLNGH